MSAEIVNIRDLKELVRDRVCSCFDIVDMRLSRLTALGENYGSIMQRVDIRIRNPEVGKEKTVYAVAKLAHTNPTVRDIFDTQVTFKKELGFYASVWPTLVEFQTENGMKGVDCFPKFLGGRINLDGSDVVDSDAALMLENLKMLGYTNVDRHKGSDLAVTKLILRDLAEFHGVTLALKLRNPEVFKEKVLPYCKHFYPPTDDIKDFKEMLSIILDENEECRPLIPKIKPWGLDQDREPREPFATLCHKDLWLNNTMQKFEEGRPVANKFVDFQMIDYGSPVGDLFFFLFSSADMAVLKDHIDELLCFYHECFIKVLEDLKCDTRPFDFDSFMEELRLETEFEFSHALMFSTFIVHLGKRSQEFDGSIDKEMMLKRVDQENRDRTCFIVLECEKRGWLH